MALNAQARSRGGGGGRGAAGSVERLRGTDGLLEERRRRRIGGAGGKRRMGNQGLVRGWTAWHEQWEEAAAKADAVAASARLARPALAASLGAWLQSWHEEVQDATTKAPASCASSSRSTWP